MSMLRSYMATVQIALQWLGMFVFAVTALVLTGASILAAFGVLPWLQLQASFGATTITNAGMLLQIGVTALAVMLCFFLPANSRIMVLENSHRRFHINMHDVSQAFAISFNADKDGMFTQTHEYDSVKERMTYMREHPDLEMLEPEIMEVAAQMSHIARDMAATYSTDKIERARGFLREREHELVRFNNQLNRAKAVTRELKSWSHSVNEKEAEAEAQLDALRDELRELLPELGYQNVAQIDGTVVGLHQRPAE
ncbi:MAG: DNA repair protein [Pseudomonadota bacterium]